jgi:hypothetical protein
MDNQRFSSLILVKRFGLIAALLLAPVGCKQTTVTVEDPDHHDSHRWDDHEVSAYQRWEAERQKPHQEFAGRKSEEQSDYWNWRHSHPDQR